MLALCRFHNMWYCMLSNTSVLLRRRRIFLYDIRNARSLF